MQLESTICPRCGAAPLVCDDASLRCGACDTAFPIIDGVPWLFAEPRVAFSHWRQSFDLEIKRIRANLGAVGDALKTKTSALTRSRLEHLEAAYTSHADELIELLKPLSLAGDPNTQATSLALKTRLPPQLGINSYTANPHRDWAWGDAENEASVDAILATLESRTPQHVLVLGSGSGRLAYDIHERLQPETTVAFDVNPLLAYLCHRLAAGQTVELHEFPLAPKSLDDTAVEQTLAAPKPARDGFSVVVGDVRRLPYRHGFDWVVTPWLVDVVDLPFHDLGAAINQLLTDDGAWTSFGSVTFANRDPLLRLSPEEMLAEVSAAGFDDPSVDERVIPYLVSPHSRHARHEQVLTFTANKREQVKAPARHQALPDWIVEGRQPVPLGRSFKLQAETTRIHAMIMSMIDGKRSLRAMAKLMEKRGLMSARDAEEAIRGFLITMFDESERPDRLG